MPVDTVRCVHTPALKGRVKISGSKNAALPILVATLLTDEDCFIENVPALDDVFSIFHLLKVLGKKVYFSNGVAKITGKIKSGNLPERVVRKLRASVLVMGPVLARIGRGSFSVPGGCAIGDRPIDLHLKGFRKMNADFEIAGGRMNFKKRKLKPATIKLKFPSVGATENILMAAAGVPGITRIINAAKEPEITALCDFLSQMGADIKSFEDTLVVKGKDSLSGCRFAVIPDRIEAGTFLIAGASIGGSVKIENVRADHLKSVLEKLSESGAKIKKGKNFIRISSSRVPKSVSVETKPYPGFPTDLQPLWAVYMLKASKSARIKEGVFPTRFMYVDELKRLGAKMTLTGNVLKVKKSCLSGAHLLACDLRAAAAMVIAGLMARGETTISNLFHLFRGYENFFDKLKSLGANVKLASGGQ